MYLSSNYLFKMYSIYFNKKHLLICLLFTDSVNADIIIVMVGYKTNMFYENV